MVVFDQHQGIVALIIIPQKENCTILHLFQSLSIATLAAGISAAFKYVNWFAHHVVLRHGIMTSVCGVVLASLFLTLCGSNSLRCDDHVLMILL